MRIPLFVAFSLLVCLEVSAQTTPVNAAAAANHPLDPLTSAEIATAVRLVRAQPDLAGGGELLFPTVTLHEPSKAEVRAFKPGRRSSAKRRWWSSIARTTARSKR